MSLNFVRSERSEEDGKKSLTCSSKGRKMKKEAGQVFPPPFGFPCRGIAASLTEGGWPLCVGLPMKPLQPQKSFM